MRITKNDMNEFKYKFDFTDKQMNINNDINYMLDKSLSMFDWVNLTDTIPEKELEKILQVQGYAIITKINDNLYACNGGLGGELDVYNRPTQAIVNIPYLNYSETLTIGKDCVVIKNDSMGMGLIPLYLKYISTLNENFITINTSLILNRANKIFSAKDENTYESVNNYIDDLTGGKLTTILERDMFESLKIIDNSSNNDDMQKLIELNQYLKSSLYNEIGLSSNYNMKRERLQNAEIELNSGNLYPLLDDMYINRLKGIEQVNEMFDTEIEITFNSSWRGRVDGLEPLDNEQEEQEAQETQEEQEAQEEKGVK